MTTIYPLDPTGISPTNRIVDEIKVVSPPERITDASFIVPNITPFFKEGFSVRLGARELTEGVDYQFIFRHIAASTHFTREIFGGVMFINKQFTGTVKLTYQVVGGDLQNSNPDLITGFTKALGAVRWVSYDSIVGIPQAFPLEYHEHDLERDLCGMRDVIDAVEKIHLAITNRPTNQFETEMLNRHIASPNAHSKAAVGLGNVMNYPPATLEELKRGVQSKYVTADTLRPWLDSLPASAFRPDTSSIVTTSMMSSEIQALRNLINLKASSTDVTNAINTAKNEMSRNMVSQQTIENILRSSQFTTAVNNAINGTTGGLVNKVNNAETKINQLTSQMTQLSSAIQELSSGHRIENISSNTVLNTAEHYKNNKYYRVDSTSTVTISLVDAFNMSVGSTIHIRKVGNGDVVLASGANTTLHPSNRVTISKRGVTAAVVCVARGKLDIISELE